MNRLFLLARSLFLGSFVGVVAHADSIEGRVLAVLGEERSVSLEVTGAEDSELEVGSQQAFRVGAGDLAIGYAGRLVKANAVFYGGRWHLEQIFPLDGLGAKAARDVNERLHRSTASLSRRKFVREGDYIPNFAMIDQRGDFLQIRQLQGRPFVLNFIFTRCTVPTMCPASTSRMARLQKAAGEAGMEDLQFVTITFDPEFDSPGILHEYADGFGLEGENAYLLTGARPVVDDLLRQFGILTMDEDGTINHTMATLLVDANGRVAYRKEGASWAVEAFMEAAGEL